MMNPFLQVALGGAAGATARYSVYRAIAWHGPGFPVATGVVNVVGSFAMGILTIALAQRFGNHYAPLLLTGFLGGFTTFSSFSLEAVNLMQEGQTGTAILYMGLSVGAGLGALYLGLELARAMA